MKTKKTMVILIATVFAFVLLFSCILLFSVKKVETKFTVATDIETQELEDRLDLYCGENLLFFDCVEIVNLLKEYPYFELVSVEKQYPNVINVCIKERLETYYLVTEDKVYVTDKDGILLKVINTSDFSGNVSREVITLSFEGVNFSEQMLGTKIVCDKQELFDVVLVMAKSVDLTDCIKSINVINAPEQQDVYFSTYTGVNILVTQALVRGEDKTVAGFNAYNNKTDDYLKTYNNIIVVLKDDGTILPIWTDK
ncbi:MAG: FtsQ-type POTRA domain-containing protein [Clostridia bacterium]|nr:FtsQ-type POTRA domain-containing protein [Clostridia bacterium]